MCVYLFCCCFSFYSVLFLPLLSSFLYIQSFSIFFFILFISNVTMRDGKRKTAIKYFKKSTIQPQLATATVYVCVLAFFIFILMLLYVDTDFGFYFSIYLYQWMVKFSRESAMFMALFRFIVFFFLSFDRVVKIQCVFHFGNFQ